MVLEILTYPNRKLKQKSKQVEKFDEKLHKLLDDMHDTMVAKNGVGLAGVQVGALKRLFIIHIPDEDGNYYPENLIEAINPKILDKRGEIIYEEGCLSIPDYYEEVKRADEVDVEYQDREGKRIQRTLSGIEAVAFQHELDHLDGHLFIEKLNYLKRKKFDKEWKKRHGKFR